MKLKAMRIPKDYRIYVNALVGFNYPIDMPQDVQDKFTDEVIGFLCVDQEFSVEPIKDGIVVTAYSFSNPNEVSGHLSIWFDDY